ncbi:metallophosphoesterase [Occallatibacter riparius]|uniref:Metallophosphoesterase n=1 Tax=Occallatibacter riparius TaxID=1002689 RepID=A0A9J7BI59_9BACT|nr:metallophosphoesterase [Occallatibacter riparius]UWZ82185.1 metallophosphoesterase [Occallatibacter riparius]
MLHLPKDRPGELLELLSRRRFLELAGVGLTGFLWGCSNRTNIEGSTSFPVLAFSDLHFNPLYDTSPELLARLVASNAGEWKSIFEGSKITALSAPGADTNYPLFKLALESIKKNRGTSPLILYTGDLLGHDISYYLNLYTGITDPATLQGFSDKTLSFVTQEIRAAAGEAPVLFAVGNCDSYTGYGPDSAFLANNAQAYSLNLLKGAADEQNFLASFQTGGYYTAEPAGLNVMVIALNTIAFSPSVQNKDGSENNADAVDAQLAWFDTQLAAAETTGKEVWLLMHAPPGADECTTAKDVNPQGHLASSTMMWEPNYQAKFLETVGKHEGAIALTFAGHTHMDEYRIMSAGNVVEIIPGVSPCFGNDPAYRVFDIEEGTLAPTDYRAFHCDLANTAPAFDSYYQYSKAYPVNGTLGQSLEALQPQLASSAALQKRYRGYYYSGNNAASPITDVNWPVYWAGIDEMWAQDLANAVNSYS